MKSASPVNVGLSVTPSADNPLVARIAGFVHWLRANDLEIGIREGLDAQRVAEHCTVLDRQRLLWGLRSLLCGNAEEWRRFDRLFDAYWLPPNRRVLTEAASQSALGGRDRTAARALGADAIEDDRSTAGEADSAARGGASRQEATHATDFQLLSDPEQMRRMEQLVERLARRMRRRLVRRLRIARAGRRVHLRRTIHASLRYGGTPLALAFQRRRLRLPRLVLLLDVSRSMSPYSYLFLRFARGLLAAFKDAQAFVYHTRLIPVTEVLRERDVERAKDSLAAMSAGWSGGTRIGESLQRFNERYARRLLTARSIVVMVSDGYDTGAPELLAAQMCIIRQRTRKIVWLNPLLGRHDYRPLASGMQAALPFVDVFESAHSLESLAALERQLIQL